MFVSASSRIHAPHSTLVLACFAAVFVSACAGGDTNARRSDGGGRGRGAGGNTPAPVTTAAVVQKPMPVTSVAVGTAEAISTVQVRSQVTGQVSSIHFAEGDEVREGQPLFTLDPQPFDVALAQAQAVLARDTAQAENARAEVNRYEALLNRGLIPREQFETQTTSAAALAATVKADQAAVDSAQLNLRHSTITAPVSGRTGSLLVHSGELVQANGTSTLVTINQVAPIYVTFSVPGTLLDDVRRFQRAGPLEVVAHVPGEEDTETALGHVTFIDNAVDVQTGAIKLKATFPNTDRALWPGQFVDVTLRLRTDPHALVVPSTAVQAGQQGQFVYVVSDDAKAELRQVKVDRVEGNESVIASGLNAGETVVTDGQLRLTPGAHVTARVSAQASAEGSR
jgi:multidrug efflux system membrane fusion protein